MNNHLKSLFKDVCSRYVNDDISSKGAELTFNLIFTFFPFIVFLITLVSFMPIIHLSRYIEVVLKILPASAYDLVNDIIKRAISERSLNLLIFSFIITLWSASGGVSSIRRGINKAYDTEDYRSFWEMSAITFIFMLELILLILLTLVFIVFGRRIGVLIFQAFGLRTLFMSLWNNLRNIISLVTTVYIFISLYIFTPNRKGSMREAIPGAVFATIGWVASSIGFSYYVNNFVNYSVLYGSIGGIIALLAWLYLSSIVIMLGAEINASLYFKKEGRKKIKYLKF